MPHHVILIKRNTAIFLFPFVFCNVIEAQHFLKWAENNLKSRTRTKFEYHHVPKVSFPEQTIQVVTNPLELMTLQCNKSHLFLPNSSNGCIPLEFQTNREMRHAEDWLNVFFPLVAVGCQRKLILGVEPLPMGPNCTLTLKKKTIDFKNKWNYAVFPFLFFSLSEMERFEEWLMNTLIEKKKVLIDHCGVPAGMTCPSKRIRVVMTTPEILGNEASEFDFFERRCVQLCIPLHFDTREDMVLTEEWIDEYFPPKVPKPHNYTEWKELFILQSHIFIHLQDVVQYMHFCWIFNNNPKLTRAQIEFYYERAHSLPAPSSSDWKTMTLIQAEAIRAIPVAKERLDRKVLFMDNMEYHAQYEKLYKKLVAPEFGNM